MQPKPLRIELTGVVRIGDVEVPGTQARVAFVSLTLNRHRPVSRDELADILWAGELPAAWDVALRGIIRKLRTAIASAGADPMATLTSSPGGYRLVLPAGSAVDVEEAEGSDAERTCWIASRTLLPGVEGTWVEARRAELRQMLVSALESLGVQGDAGAAEEAVRLEPFRESAHRALMAAHAAAGNRAEALRAYERCRELLASELGVDPSPETEAAHVELLRANAQGALPRALRSRGAFVGRTTELALLRSLWERARRGELEVALVAGEPGIGKTRLASELAAEVYTAGGRVLYGRCERESFLPYQPFAEAVGPLGGEHADRHEQFETVRDALVSAGPTLLVLDDVHWADRPSLALLRHLARSAGPLLVVATYRQPEAEPPAAAGETLAGLRRDAGVAHIVIHGLEPREVESLIAGWAGHIGPPRLASDIHARTDGNPFFVVEFLRLLAASGNVGLAAGLEDVRIDELTVPRRVREVILERVALLGEDTASVLRAAAVLGVEFDLDVLELLAGDHALDGLEKAIGKRLVAEIDAGRFAFGHSLVRETLYAHTSRARRTRLHRAAAEALERRTEVRWAEVAHHAMEAALDSAKKASYATLAAEEASSQLAYEDAADWYQRALAHVREDDRAGLLVELGDARWRAGELRQAKAVYLQAAAAARAAADHGSFARAALAIGPAAGNLEGVTDRDAVALLEEAVADEGVDGGVRVRLLVRLGQELSATRHFERRRALCDEAVRIARELGDDSVLAYALNGRRHALMGIDHLPPAEEIIDIARRAGDRHMTLDARNFRVIERMEAGDLEGAEAETEVLASEAAELRQPFYLRFAPRFRAAIAAARGDREAAQRWADEAHTTEARVHPEEAQQHTDTRLLAWCWQEGRIADMADAIEFWASSGRALSHWWAASVLLRGGPVGDLPAPDLYSRFALALLEDAGRRPGDGAALERIVDARRPDADRWLVVGYGLACLPPAYGRLTQRE